jgi:hypothetical protein
VFNPYESSRELTDDERLQVLLLLLSSLSPSPSVFAAG